MADITHKMVFECLDEDLRNTVSLRESSINALISALRVDSAPKWSPNRVRAQRAIDELRRTLPKIADAYRNPPEGYDPEDFRPWADSLTQWIEAAPTLVDRRGWSRGKHPKWHRPALAAWKFYRQIDLNAGHSKDGPVTRFISRLLEKGGFGKVEQAAIAKFLGRMRRRTATNS
ncbi:hypothetical protein IYW40_11575 [Methylocystis sp. H4A]|uniref:hypothetical protein n=1 Tax=Methylocystis sp. H4A TaxID=2785788 RepID=UPI0018C2D31E|nr:hypothetical protein [Methylocystis sp. H4A]MBG0802113.1 hypothetical protein [Methylocystis sp. H4A]